MLKVLGTDLTSTVLERTWAGHWLKMGRQMSGEYHTRERDLNINLISAPNINKCSGGSWEFILNGQESVVGKLRGG